MNKRALRQVVSTRLEERGYRLERSGAFDLEAIGTRERLLIDVRGEEPTNGKLWSAFVGAVARATLLLEQGQRGTVALAFSSDYADHLGEHLGRVDPRIVVLFLDADDVLRRLRGAWDVRPGEGPLAFAPTLVVRAPESPTHSDGRFVVGEIAYEVRSGGVAWATEGGRLIFPPPTFLDLCRRAGLTAATETAASILRRAATEASVRTARPTAA